MSNPNASKLARYLCNHHVADGSGRKIETVITGHSRGAAIGMVMATVLAGLEIKIPKGGKATVESQDNWPLTLYAVVGFAAPYSIYRKTDAEVGMKVPAGIDDQWTLLNRFNIPQRTFLFLNERDVVPLASPGHGRHFGYRFNIQGSGGVTYDGTDWGPDVSTIEAHSNVGYCSDVLQALGQTSACLKN